MAKIATRPDFMANFPSLKQQEEAKKTGATDEEQKLYGMTLTTGWEVFSKYIDQLISELDQLNDNAIAQGANYEEIGKNTLVISLTKGLIKKLMNRVDDATEVCTKQ
jgi:hypothetical protein